MSGFEPKETEKEPAPAAESAPSSPEASTGPLEFTLATWNILAQAYAFSHKDVDPAAISWPIRSELVLRTLESVLSSGGVRRPSLLCLQEVDEFDSFYRARLHALGYECRFTARSGIYPATAAEEEQKQSEGDKSAASSAPVCSSSSSPATWAARSPSKRSKRDGVLIAWLKTEFELADAEEEHSVHRVDFDDLAFAAEELCRCKVAAAAAAVEASADGHHAVDGAQNHASSNSSSSSACQLPDPRLLRHNVGLFVFLRPRRSTPSAIPAPVLLVSTVHLYWNPMHEDVKKKQVQYILARMQQECARRLAASAHKHSTPSSPSPPPSTTTPADALAHALEHTSLSPAPTHPTLASSLRAFPLIFCGDFNSSPLSGLYRFVTEGVYDQALCRSNATPSPGVGGAGDSSVSASASSSSSTTTLAPAHPPPVAAAAAPRFICDVDLIKVAKWLRSIGIDCAHFNDAEKKAAGASGFAALFDRAVKEHRVILTKSARLVERRGCPPWFLLRSQLDLEPSFAHIVQHFGLQFREDLFYSRCIFCNSTFRTIHREYYTGGLDSDGVLHDPHPPPPDLPLGFVARNYHDDDGTELTFQRCLNTNPFAPCGKLFWWGARSNAAVGMFKKKFDEILDKQHQEEDDAVAAQNNADFLADQQDADADDDAASSPAANQSRISHTRLQQLRLAAHIAELNPDRPAADSSADPFATPPVTLRSAYAERSAGGCEPPFTNVTSTFADCLDYIFYSQPQHNSSNSPSGSTDAATSMDGTTAASAAPQLHVLGVRAVTESTGLDTEQLRKNIGGDSSSSSCSNGTGECAWNGSLIPATTAAASSIATSASASSAAAAAATAATAASVVLAAPAVPLTTHVPNLVWPSDHLMLAARFSLY